MQNNPLDRRDFNKLTAAALGGLAAGVAGCASKPGDGKATAEATAAKADVHLCRGLNDCKGKGKDAKNDCRGLGTCATVVEHSCGGQNECKGLGGCGETAGANECKGHGGCHVPLMESAWDTIRKRKETEWTEKKLDFGPPPAKAA